MKKFHVYGLGLVLFALSFTSNADAHWYRYRGWAPVGIAGCYATYPSFGWYPFYLANNNYGTYGALAYSVATGSTGWASGWGNQAAAENAALVNCGVGDCEIQVWFRSACAALTVSRLNEAITGWAWSGTAATAQNLALRQCRIRGGLECKTVAWACSP